MPKKYFKWLFFLRVTLSVELNYEFVDEKMFKDSNAIFRFLNGRYFRNEKRKCISAI